MPNATVMIVEGATASGWRSCISCAAGSGAGRGRAAAGCAPATRAITDEARARLSLLAADRRRLRAGRGRSGAAGRGRRLGTRQAGEAALAADSLDEMAELTALARARSRGAVVGRSGADGGRARAAAPPRPRAARRCSAGTPDEPRSGSSPVSSAASSRAGRRGRRRRRWHRRHVGRQGAAAGAVAPACSRSRAASAGWSSPPARRWCAGRATRAAGRALAWALAAAPLIAYDAFALFAGHAGREGPGHRADLRRAGHRRDGGGRARVGWLNARLGRPRAGARGATALALVAIGARPRTAGCCRGSTAGSTRRWPS